MAAKERKCAECGSTRFLEDHSQGDIVCAGCGLVVEAHIIDERSEWRTFSDKDKESADPNRVGGPNNPLLEGGGLSTMIAKGEGSARLARLHNRDNNPDKALQKAFKELGVLTEKLRFQGGPVKNIACELYKDAMESGKLKGRSMLAICAAAMFLACRQNKTPRTFKEICAVMPPNIRLKEISACYTQMVNLMRDTGKFNGRFGEKPVTASARHPADYLQRFITDLKLGREVLKACTDMALVVKDKNEGVDSKCNEWDGRSPLSLAAAIVYTITLIKDPVPMQDLCTITNVAEGTIRLVYRDFYPSLAKLLPPGYNSPQQIAKLPVPDMRSVAAAAGTSAPAAAAAGPSAAAVAGGSVPLTAAILQQLQATAAAR